MGRDALDGLDTSAIRRAGTRSIWKKRYAGHVRFLKHDRFHPLDRLPEVAGSRPAARSAFLTRGRT